MANNEVKLTFTGDDQVSGMISGIGSAIGGLGTVALGVAAAGIAALTGGVIALGDALSESVKQAMDMQTVMAQFDAVLKSTSDSMGTYQVTSQLTKEQQDKLNEKLQKAQDQLSLMEARYNSAKHPTEAMTLAIQQQKDKIAELTQEINGGNNAITSMTERSQMSRQALLDLANSMSELSGYENDLEIKGETFMLQFQNIGADIFPKATQAANDLARRTGMDLPSAFQALGRALNDPENGIGRLNMAYKLFNSDQLKAVEDMAKAGDVAGAQTMILDALNKAVGGAAEAYGNTFAGQLDKVNIKFIEMKEALGLKVIPILEDLMNRVVVPLIPMIEMMAQNFGDFLVKISQSKGFNDFVNNVAFGLQNLFRALEQMSAGNFNIGGVLTQVFGNMASGAGSLFGSIDWSAVGKSFFDFLGQALIDGVKWLQSIDWGSIGKQISDFFTNAINSIGGFFSGIDWAQVSADIITAIKSIDWNNIGKTIHDYLISSFTGADTLSRELNTYFTKAFKEIDWGGIASAINTAFFDFLTGLFGTSMQKIGTQFGQWVMGLRGAFLSDMANLASPFAGIGSAPPVATWNNPVLSGGGGPNTGQTVINLQYSPALTTNTQADVEKIMPLIAEGANRQLRNLGVIHSQ